MKKVYFFFLAVLLFIPNGILPAPGKNEITFEHISVEDGLSQRSVYCILQDNKGFMWFGTFFGLDRYDGRTFTNYMSDLTLPGSSVPMSLRSICEDKSGTLWCGTRANGLNKFDGKTETFIVYKHEASNPTSLSNDFVTVIFEDSSGHLWIGTEGGLNKLNRRKEVFRHYKKIPGTSNTLNHDIISSINEDRDGILWVGTRAGVNKLDREKEIITQLHSKPGDVAARGLDNSTRIYRDRGGTIWIGTIGWGLKKYDYDKDIFIPYLIKPGDPPDRSGAIWVGTLGGGLNRIVPQTGISHYTTKDGLPSNIIYGIMEDNKGNLWISTNKGISRFSLSSGIFKNYGPVEGLKCYEFNNGAQFQRRDGEMFFGGVNGFISFHPDRMETNPYIPPVVFIDFKIFNKSVGIGGDSPLHEPIGMTKEIKLSYRQNIFSFEFAALDYTRPSKNQYKYMIEGLHSSWIYLGNKNETTFTNIEPGEYTLRVTGSNNDGVRNEEGTWLRIIITPLAPLLCAKNRFSSIIQKYDSDKSYF